MTTLLCPVCDQEFTTPSPTGHHRKSCSPDCHRRGRYIHDPVEPDPVVVDRLTRGRPCVDATLAERHLAITALDAHGHSANVIAHMVGLNPRTIARHRANQKAATHVE